MLIKFKNIINLIIHKISKILISFKVFRFIFFKIYEVVNLNVINSNNTSLKFYVNNYINKFRVDTLFTKEPDTIKWIDTFKEGEIFYDIGSNIGLYTCYAASRNIKTYSFEPSFFNTELLVKNISLNKLSDLVTVIPIPLYCRNSVSNFNLSKIEQGSALNSFSEKFGYNGKNLSVKMYYKTLGMTLDDCLKIFELRKPNHIKIDVDGIEHLILEGALNTLKSANSILVEISDDFFEQKNKCEQILKDLDYELISKENSNIFKGSKFEKCYNQIWKKK
ncbi:MAG: FkbM family methyltransferase [Pseudomonadota bacterium]|nr:FkbM family methyltransferase [Pseudomonadota bacterium]